MLNPEIDGFLQEVVRRKYSTELDSLVEFDVLCCRAKGASEKTIAITGTALNQLEAFLSRRGLPTDAALIGAEEIRGFTLDLQRRARFSSHPYAEGQGRKLSGHTINCYLRAIRAAWNRWVDEEVVGTNPFEKVTIPKAPQRMIPTFSEDQLRAFFNAIDISTSEGFRNVALFELYLDTMCRLSELTKARVNDLDLRARSLKVMGKGSKERVVPFGIAVQKLLWKYLNFYRPEPAMPHYDYLFLTSDGRPLSKNRVETIMRRYGLKAGITGVRCSPHTLRHTACVMWIRNGGDIFSLQRITGHASLEVLRGYVNLALGDIKSAHERHSPVDNMSLRTLRQPKRFRK